MPGPITLAVIPDGNNAVIPAKIVSAVTAVSASKGVGAGRIRPSPLLVSVALTVVVSISVTVTSMYACPSEALASVACSGSTRITSPTS
tara:strand:- start:229 stop:495 length:267 start_codon:yes stop_codon:yes gene_type:complete